ncbi:leucyl aminopeptidase [soil metagenome]
MNIKTVHGNIHETEADTLVVSVYKDGLAGAAGEIDEALGGALRERLSEGDFTGEVGEVTVLYPRGNLTAKRVVVVGLGEQDKVSLETIRKASAAATRRARKLNGKHVATAIHGASLGRKAAAQATTEGALLALYRFDAQKQKEQVNELESVTVVAENDLSEVETGVRTAQAVAAGVILARDLVNMPPNVATPSKLAEVATEMAEKYGFGLTVGDRTWAAEHDMGAFLAVAKGAGEEPKFIVLEHNAGGKNLETIVLVGKGVTFDTGGITIKPGANMGAMKSDMGGAAAVLGAMRSVGELGLPLHVVGIVPSTENMPDADAYRPADVIRASKGKTIEIISTDAEGRMILADALVYAERYEPDIVIDLATLTGSAVIALGKGVAAGLFSTDDTLRDALVAAGTTSFERVWPLPLYEEYRKTINSDVADMKNTGGRTGGVGTSAVFLQEFTNYPWAHLDIAGMALADKGGGYMTKGGTGFGVRLLVEFLGSRTA